MKVLFLLNAYVDDGPGRLIYSVASRLSQYDDIQCWSAALRRSGPLEEKFEDLAIPTKVLGMKHVYELNRYKQMVSFLRDGEFDIVHTNLIRADVIGRYAAKKAGVPVIVSTEHGIHTWRVKGKLIASLVKYLYRHTVKFTDSIIAVSEYVKQRLIEHGVPPDKVTRIYNGIDLEKFTPVSQEQREEFQRYLSDEKIYHIVGGVGNLVTLKGHSYFIQAIPKILQKHPHSLFVIVGEGPLHSKLVTDVNRLGLEHRVRFLGRLSTITAQLISSFDVLVQPSLTESFGLAVAEALACRVPVVATHVGGVPEIVKDGEHGFLVEPRNPDAIAEKVTWLLDHKEEAMRIAEKGREHVAAHFDINTTVEQYYNLYQHLLGK